MYCFTLLKTKLDYGYSEICMGHHPEGGDCRGFRHPRRDRRQCDGHVTGVLNLPPATGWEERQQEKVVKHLLKAEAGRRCFRFIRQDGNKTVVKTPAGPLSFHGNGIPLYRKPVIPE